MSYKQILVPVIALDADEAALRAGAQLAETFGARATALIVSISPGSEYAQQSAPLSEVLLDLTKGEQSAAAIERREIVAWLNRVKGASEVRNVTAESGLARDGAVAYARVADLVVISRSEEHARARRELIEDVLFKSGRPVLLPPPGAHKAPKLERILIAWNASAEAVRAIAGAMPLLQAAKQVRIVTVDAAPRWAADGKTPGQGLRAYLASHGVEAEVSNLDGLGREHSLALADAAMDFDADLVVLGAYGHSRMREVVLGGVTRDLLQAARFPMLLAH